MAKLIINGQIETEGKVSAYREVVNGPDGPELACGGVLSTRDYYEDLDSIETDRYLIDGIVVMKEDYGSEDENILYTFEADEIQIKKEVNSDGK